MEKPESPDFHEDITKSVPVSHFCSVEFVQSLECNSEENHGVLPWVAPTDRHSTACNGDVTPGEFVLRTLFTEFTVLAEKKIDHVLSEPLERPLSKSLQRGEDPHFDQLLSSLHIVAEYSLTSLLKILFKWYEKQQNVGSECDGSKNKGKPRSSIDSPKLPGKNSRDRDHLIERRDLAVDFLFCLVLIEVLKQLPVHPVDDEYILYIESLAFRHFRQRDSNPSSPSAANGHIIAAMYAEVTGVLAQSHFHSIRKRFTAEFNEHLQSNAAMTNIIYGMKYLRIKLYPVEELEEAFLFMRECATMFIDCKDSKDNKEMKHAFAAMFVEILGPVAASANREFNVPALKNFVDMLYPHALDMAKRARHSSSIYPLVTVLLCLSQKSSFLSNWASFLSMCLAHLKARDVKMQRVGLECIYRLLWTYMIRIKGESNIATVGRLRSITDTLFPRGSRAVIPRDVPLNIFVKIIHFIAHEKIDFAMNDIIFDLLGVGRSSRQISPERMNIGLRAFFVIAESLQRKGGEAPPMPSTTSTLPSGNTVRVKKTVIAKTLTDSAASSIGLANYYHSIRKALDSILRGLDGQVGRCMVLTNPHVSHKEPDEMITGERKPKIELFRTCIAAIPRCIPEGMTKAELVDLLSRLTVHMDEELKGLAFSSLQTLVTDFSDWREVAVLGFVNFILNEIQDTFPSLLDSALRMLLQLLVQWKATLLAPSGDVRGSCDEPLELSSHVLPCDREIDSVTVLHDVEGCALVLLCSIKPMIRKRAWMVLKESRSLFSIVHSRSKDTKPERPVADVIDEVFPTVFEKTLNVFSQSEKLFAGPLGNVDIMTVSEKLCTSSDHTTVETTNNIALHSYFWASLLAGLLEKNYLPDLCPTAVQFSWPAVLNRLFTVYSVIDSGTSGMDSISSLSAVYGRGPKKYALNISDVCLWRNYLVFACCTYPHSPPCRSDSPDQDGGALSEGSETKGDSRPPSPCMVDSLFRFVIPHIRSECSEVRDAVITGLGWTSPCSYRDFIEEVQFVLKEALDRRAESVRKRRKRDALRAYLAKVFELNAEHGCFNDSASELVTEEGLSPTFIEYIDGTRLYLDTEADKDMPAVLSLRVNFCNFVQKMINSITNNSLRRQLLPRDLRFNLFTLFSSWCAHFGVKVPGLDKPKLIPSAQSNDLELASLRAMCALCGCGPVFDFSAIKEDGYLYSWLQTILNSPKEKIHLLGLETLVRLMENNDDTPALLNWVIDKCYTGTKLVVSGCFRALASVFIKRNDYPCEMIPIFNIVLFKTADPSMDIREKAAQLLQLLERRFFPYAPSSISCSPRCSYSQSQSMLSRALARAHPEITVHLFEEMTLRFESTSPSGQRCLLQYMLPWLENIELVEISNPTRSTPELCLECEDNPPEVIPPVELQGEGWGSSEASQLVLHNLFYITVKYDDYYSKELEACWASLCSGWQENVHEILSYLITISGVIGHCEVLMHAKKLAVYVARANTEKAVEDLMEELKLTETVTSQFERCDQPPYLRPVQKVSCSRDSVNDSSGKKNAPAPSEQAPPDSNEQSESHKEPDSKEKRSPKPSVDHSEDIQRKDSKQERQRSDSLSKVNSAAVEQFVVASNSLAAEPAKTQVDSIPPLAEPEELDQVEEEEDADERIEVYWPFEWAVMAHRLAASEGGWALPLPVPEGQKYFAPLQDSLPFAPSPASLYRCNFALMLLTELVLDQAKVDWTPHLPLMLHIIFLGLDHGKALVYEHCKRLLVNLVIVLVCGGDHVGVAESLLNFITVSEQGLGLGRHVLHKSCWTLDVGNVARVKNKKSSSCTAADPADRRNSERKGSSDGGINSSAGTGAFDSAAGSEDPEDEQDVMRSKVVEETKELIDFLANSECKPLWAFEDITPRSHQVKSAEQLEVFLATVVHIFQSSTLLKGTELQEKWAKVALQWATSCSSRHYAGRSFQVFRAIKVPLSWTMLSDVLARLVESVGENNEDVQGYVLEILLTLESAIEWSLFDHISGSNGSRDIVIHYNNISQKDLDSDGKDLETNDIASALPSISASLGAASPLSDARFWKKEIDLKVRHGRSLSSGCDIRRTLGLYTQFGRNDQEAEEMMLRVRSASMQCLHLANDSLNAQTQTDMLTRIFWISVSLLESDYEHEFLLAIELLDKVLSFLDLNRIETRDRLERVLNKLKWTNFPGLQALLLKGFTSAATAGPSMKLLAKLTLYSDIGIVDPSQASGFALNVLALLPHMIEHFSNPDEFSKTCARNIIQVCHKSSTLANLGKMFTMYSEKSYHRPRATWIEAVCRYIHNAFGHLGRTYITFLLEVLERGPQIYQQTVLSIICALMRLVDFASSATMRQFHNSALKIISKYIKGTLWKESLDILKLAVSNSSHLDTPPPRPSSMVFSIHDSSWSLDAVMMKKELPGRTLDFTFDLSATPVIGRRGSMDNKATDNCNRLAAANSIDMSISSWKKPHLSQHRTRERLVNVLTTCGHTVGLKQSPSVVFSSSSDLAVEKQTGQQSPSEETSITDDTGAEAKKDELGTQQLDVFRDFDFLDDELEMSEELGGFGWSGDVRRQSYESLDVRAITTGALRNMDSFSGSDQDLTPHESSDDELDELSRSLNARRPVTLKTPGCRVKVISDTEPEAEVCPERERDGALDRESRATEQKPSGEITPARVSTSDEDKSLDRGKRSRSPSVSSSEHNVESSHSDLDFTYNIFSGTEHVLTTSGDDIENLWSDHVTSVVKDTTGIIAVNTYPIFAALYKVTSRKFYSLTRECCNYLEEKLRDVSTHFSNTLEFLVARGDCPYVCIDTETLSKTHMLDKQKFVVLELQEHYHNYNEKRQKTIECLDGIKMALKRSSVGSHQDDPAPRHIESMTHEQRQVRLSWCLYRLHFQFILFCGSYARLVEMLSDAVQGAKAKVEDLTPQVSQVRKEINMALEHLAFEETSFIESVEPESMEQTVQKVVDSLDTKKYEKAVQLLRVCREKLRGEVFGSSDEDNVEALTALYCKYTADKNQGGLAMSIPVQYFTSMCSDLREVNLSVLVALQELRA